MAPPTVYREALTSREGGGGHTCFPPASRVDATGPVYAAATAPAQPPRRGSFAGGWERAPTESFAGSNERLQVEFDAIYTAEDVGSYKPSDRNFDYMLAKLETLGTKKNEILHTAESMFHDHGPANRHGLASCWIYRRYDQEGFGATMNPGDMPKYDFRFNSIADLVKAHQEELRA